MADSPFYSDRVGLAVPRTSEDVSPTVWKGLVALIRRRIGDGSLAHAFPAHECMDGDGHITGTDEGTFLDSLHAHVPALGESSLGAGSPPTTVTVLDVVEFVALHIDQPSHRAFHSYGDHFHYFYADRDTDPFADHVNPGQVQFQHDVDLLFARNGIAFTLSDDMRVQRLGPPEARPLISGLRPNTGDTALDGKITDAVARFVSRHRIDHYDALEKLWDAFERLKTLELGGQKKNSVAQLLDRTAPDSNAFRSLLEDEFHSLTVIGNNFTIRHHEHNQESLPNDDAVDYLFVRMAALILLVLRRTGRLAT